MCSFSSYSSFFSNGMHTNGPNTTCIFSQIVLCATCHWAQEQNLSFWLKFFYKSYHFTTSKNCMCCACTYFSFLQGYKNEEVLFLSPYLDFCKTRVIKSRKNGELGSKTSVHVNGVKKRKKIELRPTFC